jgi:hypothetical protein
MQSQRSPRAEFELYYIGGAFGLGNAVNNATCQIPDQGEQDSGRTGKIEMVLIANYTAPMGKTKS